MATNLISSAAAAVNAVSEASVGTATPIAAPRRSSARRLKASRNMGTSMSVWILIDLPPRPRTLAARPELQCNEGKQFPLFTADRPRQHPPPPPPPPPGNKSRVRHDLGEVGGDQRRGNASDG